MTTNRSTKAQFDAEKIEAGYKYLYSLRELMGVGQPVGEGGVLELLPCPNPSCRSVKVRSGSSLYPFYIYCANCLMKGPREGSDNLGSKWNNLPRATQPATAPGDAAAHAETQQFFDDLLSETPAFRTTKEAMEYAARHEIPSVIPVATPTDIAERARRAARAYLATKSHIVTSDPTGWQGEESRLADIIAAEFGGGDGGDGDEKGT